ncbi:hypothetical protein C7999DRAFT_44488 [Corynascus novoguineensis]|uniref:Fungal N-terminal domain-containing protein n=1 Tax=Corynascus novoguineensis TaxID=1126955 RepID=A0AAN7CN24_9PEZI|nr:hypothetical protein C7999DRAFT_44488 [Corynascus novoguineensis]
MDPLSIAASAITLIQAVGNVTMSLQRLVRALKTAGSRITELCNELSESLCIRNNAGQEMILSKLDRLKSSINEALRASLQPSQAFSHGRSSDARVSRNLRNLAEAASQFHTTASSTASTIDGHGSSLLGDFPSYRRERVERFIRSVPGHNAGDATPAVVASPAPDSVFRSPLSTLVVNPQPVRVTTSIPRWSSLEDVENDEDDEAEFERLFLDGLEDLAKDSIGRNEFEKAIGLLTEAIQRKGNDGSEHEGFQRLQTQLALCHFFRDDWRQAEPIVSALTTTVNPHSCLKPVIWTMIHALSLGHLSTYEFDNALKTCKKAIKLQRKWMRATGTDRRDVQGCAETTGLLATIYEMQGDYIAAEIYRRQLPQNFAYQHFSNPRKFLSDQRDALGRVLGGDLPDFCDQPPGSTDYITQPVVRRHITLRRYRTVNGGYDTTPESPLRACRHQWEKFELDTTKEVIVSMSDSAETADTDHEDISMATYSPSETCKPGLGDLRRRATRIFGSGRRRNRARRQREPEYDPEPDVCSDRSPIRRWLKGVNMFAVKPSRGVLKKSPNNGMPTAAALGRKRPGTFRVINVRRFTLDSVESFSNHQLPEQHPPSSCDDCPVSELSGASCDSSPSERTPANEWAPASTEQVAMQFNDSVPSSSNGSRETQLTLSVSERHVALGIAELMGTPLHGTSMQQASNPADIIEMVHRYSLGEMSYLAFPQSPKTVTAYEAHAWLSQENEVISSDADIHLITAPAGGAEDQDAPFEADHHLAGAAPQQEQDAAALQHKPTRAAALPDEVITILSRLACILASLPACRELGGDRLRASRHELKALLASLEGEAEGMWNADPVLHRDVQAVLDSLFAEEEAASWGNRECANRTLKSRAYPS